MSFTVYYLLYGTEAGLGPGQAGGASGRKARSTLGQRTTQVVEESDGDISDRPRVTGVWWLLTSSLLSMCPCLYSRHSSSVSSCVVCGVGGLVRLTRARRKSTTLTVGDVKVKFEY